MRGTTDAVPASSAILTVPNLLSLARIVAIPLFCWLTIRAETRLVGVALFAIVVGTDWIDGWVARRFEQVSELGRILDPLADRLAIAAGLLTFAIIGIFPFWAALLILLRDVAVVLVGAALLWTRNLRVDVRGIGKVATFTLMLAITWIAWGNAGGALGEVLLAGGWLAFVIGIVEYYLATGIYAIDIRDALASRGVLES